MEKVRQPDLFPTTGIYDPTPVRDDISFEKQVASIDIKMKVNQRQTKFWKDPQNIHFEIQGGQSPPVNPITIRAVAKIK